MLQPHQPSADQQLMTSRIVWGALTMSMFMYGFVLFSTGQITRVEELSHIPSSFELIAVLSNTLALISYYIFKNKIQPEKDFQKRFPLSIACWAMNEAIVICGFIAVFVTADGNALFYVTNLAVGLVMNAITFPRK